MVAHYYSSIASEMTLAAGIDGAAGSMTLSGVSGLPTQTPYTLVIDPDTSSEEIVTVTNRSGSTFTITRAQEGTPALSHSTGAKVRHKATARDLRWGREHEESSVAHGRSSALVGISDPQTLTNKTMSGASNDFDDIPYAALNPPAQTGIRRMSKNTGSYGGGSPYVLFTAWNEVHPSDGASTSGISYGVAASGALSLNESVGGPWLCHVIADIAFSVGASDTGGHLIRVMRNSTDGEDGFLIDAGRAGRETTSSQQTVQAHAGAYLVMSPGDYVQVWGSHVYGGFQDISSVPGLNRFELCLIRPR